MYILYADDSGNTGTDYENKDQPIFSLAGWIINTDNWTELNDFINEKKKEIMPEYFDVEIHTTDIFNGKKDKNGTFDFRKNGLQGNFEILDKLVDMAISLNPKVLVFIVRKEKLKEYCRKKYDMKVKIDPYLIAFPYLSKFFDEFLSKENAKGLIFLDEQEKVVDNIDNILFNLRLSDNSTDLKINNIVERAVFLNSFKSNFIQIADLFNFYINRYKSIEEGRVPTEEKRKKKKKNYHKIQKCIVKSEIDPFKFNEMLNFFDDYIHIFAE